MSKIVCNSIDFVFVDELDSMVPGQVPVLKLGKTWKKIDVTEKPVYQSSVKQNDAGPTSEETVSAKARRNNLTGILIERCGFNTVLRMSTDENTFHVGTPDYPCVIEYSSDRAFDTYSFKSVSPA